MNSISSPFKPIFVYHSDFDPTESKIRSFASYQNGWHYAQGITFSETAINDALVVHRQIFFKGFTRTNAFPGPTGQLQITMYHRNHYFGFEREASGLWNITHEINGQDVEILEQESFDEVLNYVNALDAKICDIFDVYSKNIGTSITIGSLIMPLYATKGQSRSLAKIACSNAT
jgi:hypothetical protein